MKSNRNHYIINEYEGKKFLTFPILSEFGIKHCFSTSDSLCASITTEVDIISEYTKISHFAGILDSISVFTSQVHSNHIEIVSPDHLGTDYFLGNFFENTDGLMTDSPNIALVTKFADCTPIFIYDPVHNAMSNLHSGWRGTSKKIAEKAILMMKNKYGSNPADLIVVIGPCIGKNDFEVQQDVVNIFKESYYYNNDFFSKKDPVHYLFDMQGLIERSLTEIGVFPQNIFTADISTYSSEFMHSFRRDGSNSGRMALMASLI